ncbi:hypothetical protein XHV734_4224 [Xanthomonas hortorum pv. vitians]|nr:hypothetical protein XHV734_4224 [Xanthomonas hortorum pv. vitians]
MRHMIFIASVMEAVKRLCNHPFWELQCQGAAAKFQFTDVSKRQ